MREWLRNWLIKLLELDATTRRIGDLEAALVEAKRELRKDIAGAQFQRDYAHQPLAVLDWETAQAIELQKLNADAAKTRS